MKTTAQSILITVSLICLALLPRMQAGSPAPDGCYPNFTTAEGCDALNALTTGAGNTGLGSRSLLLNTTGNFNTGVGGGALALNNGDSNTAVGAAALLLNTTGTGNIALGASAGINLTTSGNNIDIGNSGVAGDANMIRIGDPAIQTGIFLAGIIAMSPQAPNQAELVNPTTGQLGNAAVGSFPPGPPGPPGIQGPPG